jgi:ABC-type spermidine/putrescine transport system permease subunit II
MTAIVEIFLIAFFSPMVTYMLDYFTEPDEIFGFYKVWLKKYSLKWWSKPLGLCPTCANIWVTLILGVIYFTLSKPFIIGLFGLGLSNFMLKKIYQ